MFSILYEHGTATCELMIAFLLWGSQFQKINNHAVALAEGLAGTNQTFFATGKQILLLNFFTKNSDFRSSPSTNQVNVFLAFSWLLLSLNIFFVCVHCIKWPYLKYTGFRCLLQYGWEKAACSAQILWRESCERDYTEGTVLLQIKILECKFFLSIHYLFLRPSC